MRDTVLTENEKVLILVFVEFTLREAEKVKEAQPVTKRLNPCFCGIYSQRRNNITCPPYMGIVLILVFVEFTLREENGK